MSGPRGPARPGSPPLPLRGWAYEVNASPGGEELAVEAAFGGSTGEEFSVSEGAEPFLRELDVEDGHGWSPVAARGASWFLPVCNRGCRVRYRYALGDAARDNDHVRVARKTGAAIVAAPSVWLLRPVRAPLGTPFRFHVHVAPGDAFVSGVFPLPGAMDTYAGKTSEMFELPYAAFGRLRTHELEGGKVLLAVLPGALPNEDEVVAWASSAAHVVAGYYGGFPVERLAVIVRPVERSGVGFGTTTGNAGAAIAIDVGGSTTLEAFGHDWILVHEMVHTALPDLLGPHHWLEEGLATYVEPIARAEAGLRRPEDVWSEWVSMMPNGLPAEGDLGLDRTPTWGRTYWGGALYCFLTDLEIRERTGGKKSLQDAVTAIDRAAGGIAGTWTLDRVLEIGDAATGVPAMRIVYDRMGTAPAPVDLDAVWARFGVAPARDSVKFNDTAPLADLRRSWFGR
jgi:hypothetical protein